MQYNSETIYAAGILLYCTSTQRFLIAKRGDMCPEPGTLCSIGGKTEFGLDNNFWDTAIREFKEEAGAWNVKNIRVIDESVRFDDNIPTEPDKQLVFQNYVAIIDREFIPIYNYENSWVKWLTAEELLNEKHNWHFGLVYLLSNLDTNTFDTKFF